MTTAAVATDRQAYPQSADATADFGRFAGQGIIGWLAAARARARTRRVLRSLDEYALKDIGLTRSQIDFVETDPRYSPRHLRF